MILFNVKFSLCLLFTLVSLVGFLLGGAYLWTGIIFILIIGFLGDGVFKSDTQVLPDGKSTWFLNFLLFSHLPFIILINLIFAWHLGPGDPWGLGTFFLDYFGWDLMTAKEITRPVHLWGGVMTMGFVYGIASTNVAHELVHRIRHKPSISYGRWLLGFTLDTTFSIEHVFGHHQHVSTIKDPSSARRGESSWYFLYRSTKESLISAWYIEKRRLTAKKKAVFSYHNLFLRGQLISFIYGGLYYVMAGYLGVVIFLLMAVYGKAYLEFINYIEHYGLVRKPGTSIELRHSWNSNHPLSSYLLYNLPRHAYHHINSVAPYWKIKPCSEEAPKLPYGYLYMIFFSMFPPIYKKIMIPLIQKWDLGSTTPEEKILARQANDKAGWSSQYLDHHDSSNLQF